LTTRQRILLAFVSILVVGFGAGMWWLSRDEVSQAPVEPVVIDQPLTPVETDKRQEPTPLAVDDGDARGFESLDTTVVFPLKVELELARARNTPRAEGSPALGSGATARLKGSIMDGHGNGVRAQIEFIAGTNLGRVLYCDATGAFGAHDLYPGISIVRVAGPNIAGSMREVRLRQERESLLNISYALPAHVMGQVFDTENKLVAGAKVTMDGQATTTDDSGTFEFTNMTAGESLCIIEKEGFAPYREIVSIVVSSRVELGRFKFLLRRGARLVVSIEESINAGQAAQLYVLPEVADAQRKFPWQKVNPTPVWPGGTATIEDLPPGPVMLRLYHAGAVAKPARSSVVLAPGETSNVTMHLEPSPVLTGIVKDGGKPLVGAIVRLEAPDRVNAMLSVFGETNYLYLEGDVFPNLPPAVQEVKTDGRGEFTLNANEHVSRVRYLSVASDDRKRGKTVILKGGESRVDLVLEPIEPGEGVLEIEMDGRIQGLPVEVTINGEPREKQTLPGSKDLRIGNLPSGSWLVTITWSGEKLLTKAPVEIDDEATLSIELPKGAIFGQDEDTVRRSGVRSAKSGAQGK
jgi:hypothetical protein